MDHSSFHSSLPASNPPINKIHNILMLPNTGQIKTCVSPADLTLRLAHQFHMPPQKTWPPGGFHTLQLLEVQMCKPPILP